MKLLHTSDWHLGRGESNNRSLIDDQKYFVDEICDIVDREKVDAVLIAGDVYDRSVAPAEAIHLYNEAMTRLCLEMKRKVIVIAGNHDNADRLEGCRDLLEKSGLHVLGAIGKEPCIVSIDDTDIYLFPWFTEEKVKGLYPDRAEEIKTLTDAYRVVLDRARSSFNPARKHIAKAHAFVTNSETSGSDKAAEIASIGTALQVDSDVFEGFDYVALGHIHGPQNIGKYIRYSGTPMAYSFGREEKQEKSVTLIDTDTLERTVIPLHPLHKRITLEADYEEFLNGEYPEDVRNGYVRLKVKDCFVGLDRLSRLREIFSLCLEVQGKNYEGEDSGIRMTMEEFKAIESDPAAIFKSFCREILNTEPNDHQLELFRKSMEGEED